MSRLKVTSRTAAVFVGSDAREHAETRARIAMTAAPDPVRNTEQLYVFTLRGSRFSVRPNAERRTLNAEPNLNTNREARTEKREHPVQERVTMPYRETPAWLSHRAGVSDSYGVRN